MYMQGTCKTVITNSKAEVMLGVLKPYINSITCIILQLAFLLLCIVCSLSTEHLSWPDSLNSYVLTQGFPLCECI